ncbi:phospho-sugar mutase [Calditerricola satsumensis]|nr:phospho-sugar mutase [Calditerricola satsumensis]
MKLYRLWLEDPYFDETIRQELVSIGERKEIEDRFYRYLEFGTGGLRGLIGAGTNRINRYTVRHATQGLSNYIHSFGPAAAARGVVIAYDSRQCSREFALEAALTLNTNGILAYLWDSLRPTPMLSFAVRELGTIAGIVITASHNPPEYNGYKVYWEDGGQIPPERAAAIQAAIRAIEDITKIHPMPEEEARAKGFLKPVPPEIDRKYYDRLLGLVTTTPEQRAACRILYTPLHGTGNIPVRTVLTEAGYPVTVVKEQEHPDPNFSTVKCPNPEEPEVFQLALRIAAEEQSDVILATDPDADRLGVMVRDRNGNYRLLNGNQVGAILVDFILSTRKAKGTLPPNGAVIKTIATSYMIEPLCREYGVELLNTHTGFKFIGDKIREFEETGTHTFLFGYEESYGYLGATFVRDKDAVMAALLVAEAVAYHKAHGRTLYDALQAIWAKCGCFLEDLHSVTLPGKEGQVQIAAIMEQLRREPPTSFGGIPVAYIDDYQVGVGLEVATGREYPLELGKANVLHFRFADRGFVMVRPSGTEPKLKIYFSVTGKNETDAHRRLEAVKADALRMMNLPVVNRP